MHSGALLEVHAMVLTISKHPITHIGKNHNGVNHLKLKLYKITIKYDKKLLVYPTKATVGPSSLS